MSQIDLELIILQSYMCWDSRHVPLFPTPRDFLFSLYGRPWDVTYHTLPLQVTSLMTPPAFQLAMTFLAAVPWSLV